MIYAYDLALLMPTKDIYDTQMMLSSIQAAKDMYNDRKKQLEDFNKLYSDFYSPIAEDNDTYNYLTSGRVRDAIDYMYQNGIDPLRSAEGGALLNRIISTTPTREINAIKQNAAAKAAYDKAVADAKKAGTYNEEFEQQLLENAGLLNFRTINPDGSINAWGRTTPGIFKTLHEYAEPEYNKFDATEYIGQSRPGYNLYGVSKENQALASEAALNQLKTNPELYSYYVNKAQDYMVEGESTDDALRRMINQDAQHWLQPKEEIDPYYKARNDANLEISTYEQKQKIADKYDLIKFQREHPEYYDKDGNYIGNSISNSGGSISSGSNGYKQNKEDGDLRAYHLFGTAAAVHDLQYPFALIDPILYPNEAKALVSAWANKIENDQHMISKNVLDEYKQEHGETTKINVGEFSKNYLSRLETAFDPTETADLLRLGKQDAAGYYTFTESDLNRTHAISTVMADASHPDVLRQKSGIKRGDNTSKRIREQLRSDARRGNYIVLPTGMVAPIMDKDGVLKLYARCNLYKKIVKGNEITLDYENPKEVLMDFGSSSYSLTKDNRGIFGIDEANSMVNDAVYNPAKKQMLDTEKQ